MRMGNTVSLRGFSGFQFRRTAGSTRSASGAVVLASASLRLLRRAKRGRIDCFAEPVITSRAQLRSSMGARSRDPFARNDADNLS